MLLRQFVGIVLNDVGEIGQQPVRHLTEVDDEVERVLYLVGNTGAERSKRSQFLLLLELFLELFYLFHNL